jgi:multidrug efflux pump
MKLTAGAIRRYPMIFAFMALATILGLKSYLELPRESSPDVKIPFVMVSAPYAGTSPADMENLVTRKLEQRLKGVEDLKEMSSSSSYGMSVITLEFDSRVDMSDALQSVRDRVELAKPELPEDPRDDLVVQEISSSDAFPVMQVNLYGDIDLEQLKRTGEDLQEALEQIRGVLGVDLVGGIENEVQVDVDPEKLAYFDLGLVDVQDAIALQNLTIPGGKLSLGQYDYQVRVRGEIEDVDELLGFVLNPGITPPVHLGDVATVKLGIRDRETISRVNGRDAVTLVVKKRSGENLIAIARDVNETIERLKPAFPAGMTVNIVADQSIQIKRMVKELEDNIISGLILVVVVLLAFFGVRNSIIVAVAIPFSMLITFIVLALLGITLNMVVLFSLILALGMLVDNSIVIVDNVYRHRGEGRDADTAAALGTDQVAGAVTSSTLTTVVAFAPLIFWPGIMGEFMKYLPITVIITLLASLLVAMVFNPVLCARFLRPPRLDRRQAAYRRQAARFRHADLQPRAGVGTEAPLALDDGHERAARGDDRPVRRLQRRRGAVPRRRAPVRHGQDRRAQRHADRGDGQPGEDDREGSGGGARPQGLRHLGGHAHRREFRRCRPAFAPGRHHDGVRRPGRADALVAAVDRGPAGEAGRGHRRAHHRRQDGGRAAHREAREHRDLG